MSLNTLKIASDGYLKKTTKAVLIIAVSGYLNFGTTPPSPISSRGSEIVSGGGFDDIALRRKLIQEDDAEIILICKAFLYVND